jgi:tRNA 2-(methylsulfanyl)-N6-isopentenyladenosine37 hydroxylase
MTDLTAVKQFLRCETPASWVEMALENLDILLVDHANCEKKAAATAMNLMYRYVDKPMLLEKMAHLAREELLHFEQVVRLMSVRGLQYAHLTSARYAGSLREHVRTFEPARLIDTLIIGAFVEARSCERFAVLVPYLSGSLQKYYKSLLKSEARHFELYLELAREYAGKAGAVDVDVRINFFAELEAGLINSNDTQFRFHSGIPVLL